MIQRESCHSTVVPFRHHPMSKCYRAAVAFGSRQRRGRAQSNRLPELGSASTRSIAHRGNQAGTIARARAVVRAIVQSPGYNTHHSRFGEKCGARGHTRPLPHHGRFGRAYAAVWLGAVARSWPRKAGVRWCTGALWQLIGHVSPPRGGPGGTRAQRRSKVRGEQRSLCANRLAWVYYPPVLFTREVTLVTARVRHETWRRMICWIITLFVWLISYRLAVLLSQNKSVINHQSTVFFSQKKSAQTTDQTNKPPSHYPSKVRNSHPCLDG
jgi:hypothetical protein